MARSLDSAKQFEQFTLLVNRYTNASVYHRDDDFVVLGVRLSDALDSLSQRLCSTARTVLTVLRVNLTLAREALQIVVLMLAFSRAPGCGATQVLANDSDLTVLFGEFERVRLQVHEHLLQSLLVGHDEVILLCYWYVLHELAVLCRETDELGRHGNQLGLRLVLLNGHDVLDGPLQIEPLHYLAEFVGAQLCKAQNVFDIEQKEAAGGRLNLISLHYLLLDHG